MRSVRRVLGIKKAWKWALARLSQYPIQNSGINVLNTKLRRKHRSEFDKNGFESEYDDLRKKIYFRLLNTSRWWHKQSEYSNVQNISMLILKMVANDILNAMAGVSSPNSIVCRKVVFRSFNKWVIRCYMYIAGLNIVSYKCGLLQTSPLKNIASSQYTKTRSKK